MPATKEVPPPAAPERVYRSGFCGGSMFGAGPNKWVFVSFSEESHRRCRVPSCSCKCHTDHNATPWFDHLSKEQRDAAIAASPRPAVKRVARRPAPRTATVVEQAPIQRTPRRPQRPGARSVEESIPTPRRAPRRPGPKADDAPPPPRRIPRRPTR